MGKKISIFYFQNELTESGEKLIDSHVEECGSLIRFIDTDTSPVRVAYYLKKIMEMKFTPLFVHVYPGGPITVFIKETAWDIKPI